MGRLTTLKNTRSMGARRLSRRGFLGTTTSMCVLANLSLQLKRSLTWDEASGQVAGDEEANKLLARPYRAPWVHPVVEKV